MYELLSCSLLVFCERFFKGEVGEEIERRRRRFVSLYSGLTSVAVRSRY